MLEKCFCFKFKFTNFTLLSFGQFNLFLLSDTYQAFITNDLLQFPIKSENLHFIITFYRFFLVVCVTLGNVSLCNSNDVLIVFLSCIELLGCTPLTLMNILLKRWWGKIKRMTKLYPSISILHSMLHLDHFSINLWTFTQNTLFLKYKYL